MRWIALPLVCAGLGLAYAGRELTRDPGAGLPEPELPASVEPPAPESRPEAGARVRSKRAGTAQAAPESDRFYYQYVDDEGRVQFAQRLDEVPEAWRDRAGRISLPPAPSRATPKRARRGPATRSQPEIEIYTLKSCGYCRAAMAHMDRKGIAYTNRDVQEDPEAAAEYLEKTGGRRGVPVIDVGGEIMQGWSARKFDALVASKRP